MLDKRDSFKRAYHIMVNFLSPVADDTVTTNNLLRFNIPNAPTEPLLVECSLNGEVFAQLDEIPKEIPFSTEGVEGQAELKVKIWFFNVTCRK